MTTPMPTPDVAPVEPSPDLVVVNDAVVTAISQHVGDENLTTGQISAVLSAWNTIRDGDPLGTVKRDDKTGSIATRVAVDGVHLWKVNCADGTSYNDMQPSLPWAVLFEPQ